MDLSMSMKFLNCTIAVYRNYSTHSRSKTTRYAQIGFNSKYNTKNDGATSPRTTSIKWTDEQSQVLSAISSRKSVFITGSAGSGKTVLIKHIVEKLKDIHGSSGVIVTASTGVAACALHGQTLHSFAGVGLGAGDKEDLLLKVLSYKRALKRWKKVKALVIDEISMINAELFESLEYIARETRPRFKGKVWGGIQLVVSGDFLQLPPVGNNCNSSEKLFAFQADCWNSTFDLQVELTTIFRQVDDKLIQLLQGIRRGETDPGDLQLLEQCCSLNEPDPSVVRLYPRIQDVNRVNRERMQSLEGEIITYTANDSGEDPWKRQLKQGLAPDVLELCKGARVMLTKNLNASEKLVNGTTGTIIGFGEVDPADKSVAEVNCDNLLPIVKFDSGKAMLIGPEKWEVIEGDIVHARRKQIPLILSWALSIHKCQGMTLDSLHTDLSRAFGCGMVYVALSRVRSLDGLHLSGFKSSKIKADPKVLQYYQHFATKQGKENVDDGVNMIEK